MRLQLKHHLQQEILDHSKQLHLSEALAFEHQYRVYLVGLLDNAASLLDSLTYPQQAYTRLVLTPQAARVFLEYLLTTGEIELPANLLSP
ncbi:hypothetical protein [Endozoicomonas numazuensis]|nr:hypothetical protein [Endozoicomonas numazuensis]